jgi:hypothetical protein
MLLSLLELEALHQYLQAIPDEELVKQPSSPTESPILFVLKQKGMRTCCPPDATATVRGDQA